MRYVIVDLEATCWESGHSRDQMEIIEIGAVLLPSAADKPSDEFARFIRPAIEPTLSDFCKNLTSIAQTDVDNADTFPTVFDDFLKWIGADQYVLCSWGAYDLNQFRLDCQRHGIPFPDQFERHINLKKEFASLFNVKPCGMATALKRVGIPLKGTHHRGIDDARNIASLARLILPQIEYSRKVDATCQS